MIDTKKFRTRQEFVDKENPKGSKFIIGLDAGYSSMKVYTENGYFCFPSFVKKLDGALSRYEEDDILYEDVETHEQYLIGKNAQNMIESTDTNDTDGELFSRKRYNNTKFRILCKAAIAIALMGKAPDDDREVIIQTGLPTAYLNADTKALKTALSVKTDIIIKVGSHRSVEAKFAIEPDNIFVMAQPMGSFYSVAINSDGEFSQNAPAYLSNNVLVMDIGFGTFDFYGVKQRKIVCKDSIDDISMRMVLAKAAEKIRNELEEDIRVPAMQKYLECGYVNSYNYEDMSSEEKPIARYVDEANVEVFNLAFEKAKETTDYFRDYKYIIIAGGTGEAWYPFFKEKLINMKTIEVLPSNAGSNISFIYSNVRGYYLSRYNQCK